MRKASSRSTLFALVCAALGAAGPLAPLQAQTVQSAHVAPVGAPSGAVAAGARAGSSLTLPLSPATSLAGGPSLVSAPRSAAVEGLKAVPAASPAAAAGATGRSAAATAEAGRADAPAAESFATEVAARAAAPTSVRAGQDRKEAASSEKALAAGVSASAKAAAPGRTAETGAGELSAFYDGSAALRAGSEAVGTGVSRSEARRGLERASREAGAVRAEPTPPAPTPRASLGRTFKVGYIGAIWMLFVSEVVPEVAAAFFHYAPHPNYEAPAMASPTAWAAFALMLTLSVLAPISEEVIFRSGLMRWLRVKFEGLAGEIGRFWIPALVTSGVFTVLHETSDPLLIAVRVLGAMILARVYYKEGVLASMVTHGFFNGILGAVMLAGVFSMPFGAAVGLGTAAVGAFLWASRSLWRERADRASGAVVPVKMSPAVARVLAVVLVAGTVLVALWGGFSLAAGGAVLWLPAAWGLRHWARLQDAGPGRAPGRSGIPD